MKAINPVVVTTAMLAASSVPEADYPEWSATATYARGQRCIRAALHRVFESVPATGNTGHDPATDAANWLDVGPTSRWAMFDQVVGTYTTGTGSISVTLAPGAVGALAVLDTNAETVRVKMTSGSTTLYDRTQATNKSGGVIEDWYAYFIAPIGKVSTLTFLDLPLVGGAQVVVALTGPDPQGEIHVGTLLVGTAIDLGLLEAEPTVSVLDFSKKVTDDFGATSVVERAWSKQMQVKSLVDSAAVDGIQRTVASLRARPVLWLAEEGYDALAIYGFYKDFSITLATETISYVSLTVEGLI